jgi:hypothetical protein
MTSRTPPKTASIATKDSNSDKLFAPSAQRNAEPITQAIKSIAPKTGEALEIASGTGQHIVALAAALPELHWCPSEIDPIRRASIEAYVNDAKSKNIALPTALNATKKGWSETMPPKALVTLVNLLHLISEPETETLISEAAKTLSNNGKLFLYGPFKRDGVLVSEGDANFDASIRENDPETGYKDDAWVKSVAAKNGLSLNQTLEMPANNLALVFTKQG